MGSRGKGGGICYTLELEVLDICGEGWLYRESGGWWWWWGVEVGIFCVLRSNRMQIGHARSMGQRC